MSGNADMRRSLRALVAGGLYWTGGSRALQAISQSYELSSEGGLAGWRRVTTAKYSILCYHRVGTKGIPLYCSLAPEVFEMQMRFIRKRYRVISLQDLRRELEEPRGSGEAVVVTFDDGYRDLYTTALPTLKRYEIPATVFLTVNSIETGEVAWYDRVFLALQVFPTGRLQLELDQPYTFELRSHEHRLDAATQIVSCLRKLPDEQRLLRLKTLEQQIKLPAAELADRMLTWEQCRAMQRSGVAFGSHTMTHPVVSRLSEKALESELSESKKIMEDRLDREVLDFAYPFGHPDDCGTLATPTLIRCGYLSACTTSWGVNAAPNDRYRLRRIQLAQDSSRAKVALQIGGVFLRGAEYTQADRELHIGDVRRICEDSNRVGSER